MMPPRTLGSSCPICQIATRPQIFAPTTSGPWLAQSFVTKTKSSRMVLADRKQVARQETPRRPADGPFGGMNTTYFKRPDTPRRGTAPISKPRTRSASATKSSHSGPDKKTSREDFKALKMQRALSDVSYRKRNIIKEGMLSYESFDQFDLLPSVQQAVQEDALSGLVGIKPTPVQRLAIPALLGQNSHFTPQVQSENTRHEFLLAAETGSGKTLAYLLPAINALKKTEAEDPDIQSYKKRFEEENKREKKSGIRSKLDEPHSTMARPKVVVLVPSAELVEQVASVAKRLSHAVKFKSEKLSSKQRAVIIERNMYSPRGVDLVVATPHLLASIAESDPNVLSRVTDLIVDEADSLFDRSFEPVTSAIVEKALPSVKRFVCCSATIPRGLDKYLTRHYPTMARITTPNLHAVPRRVQLGVIDVSKDPYRDNKDLAVADAIYTIGREASRHETGSAADKDDEMDIRRILIFVNERESVQPVADYLKTKGIDAVALHRDTDERQQSAMLASFTSAESLRIPAPQTAPVKGQRSLPNVKVIVATDLASRGIDTVAVRHVILYDVPQTSIDFIHRLGRAGRMGRRGRGIVLAGRKDRKDVISEVKRAMFMGQALI